MTKQQQPVPTDIHQLAEDARRLTNKQPNADAESVSEVHMSLAADLDRVRGVAVQRAKKANVRLRKQAVGATALSFGIGIAMGLLASRCRNFLSKETLHSESALGNTA